MKVNIEIIFDEVNYDEIEEVDEITLYDSIDGWITEAEWPVYESIDDEKSTAIDKIEEHLPLWSMSDDIEYTRDLSYEHITMMTPKDPL